MVVFNERLENIDAIFEGDLLRYLDIEILGPLRWGCRFSSVD